MIVLILLIKLWCHRRKNFFLCTRDYIWNYKCCWNQIFSVKENLLNLFFINLSRVSRCICDSLTSLIKCFDFTFPNLFILRLIIEINGVKMAKIAINYLPYLCFLATKLVFSFYILFLLRLFCLRRKVDWVI